MISIRKFILPVLMMGSTLTYGQEVLSLDKVLQEIRTNNPLLKSFDSQIASQDAKIEGAGSWMAPMVGAGTFMTPYPGSKVEDESDKGAWMFSAEQDIPHPAKVKAKEKYLAAQSSITRAAQGVQANLLNARAKQLYYELIVANKKIAFQNIRQRKDIKLDDHGYDEKACGNSLSL